MSSPEQLPTLPAGAVVAVVVTRHRRELLADSLKMIAAQTRPPDHLVVVDNGPDEPAGDIVASCGVPSTYLPSRRNLGGAGGFALGMLHALLLGAEWVWCADDDGRPADETVLATLLAEAERRGLAEISPMVTNIDTPERARLPAAPRADVEAQRGRARHRLPARHRVAVQRRAVPRVHFGRRRGAGLPAVLPRRRGGDAPAAGAFRAAVRHLPQGGVPAPGRLGRVQADAGRAAARAGPGERGEAVLHLPQPRVPARPSRGCARSGCSRSSGSGCTSSAPSATRRRSWQWLKLCRQGRRERFFRM